MLINLTAIPTNIEQQFLSKTLEPDHFCLVTGAALPLAFRPKEFQANCVLKDSDAEKFGGQIHESWKTVTTEEWFNLIENNKTICW